MISLVTKTVYKAPVEQVFDANRDVSLHQATQRHRGEIAIDGVTVGLLQQGDEVEWEARHFGIRQRLRVKITTLIPNIYLCDEQISGPFGSYRHHHYFQKQGPNTTEKMDIMEIEGPLQPLGKAIEPFLKLYMTKFLVRKNEELKRLIESNFVSPSFY